MFQYQTALKEKAFELNKKYCLVFLILNLYLITKTSFGYLILNWFDQYLHLQLQSHLNGSWLKYKWIMSNSCPITFIHFANSIFRFLLLLKIDISSFIFNICNFCVFERFILVISRWPQALNNFSNKVEFDIAWKKGNTNSDRYQSVFIFDGV